MENNTVINNARINSAFHVLTTTFAQHFIKNPDSSEENTFSKIQERMFRNQMCCFIRELVWFSEKLTNFRVIECHLSHLENI